ncbi:hypothetical protein F4808DRAFT_418552 [Astrocystis sublimbata]|nr:hypothetical protein F4808DRAFT_418552 [Astrocystis sublimbata]
MFWQCGIGWLFLLACMWRSSCFRIWGFLFSLCASSFFLFDMCDGIRSASALSTCFVANGVVLFISVLDVADCAIRMQSRKEPQASDNLTRFFEHGKFSYVGEGMDSRCVSSLRLFLFSLSLSSPLTNPILVLYTARTSDHTL